MTGTLFCFAHLVQVTSLRRLLDDDIMEHLAHITELSDRYTVADVCLILSWRVKDKATLS